MCGAPINVVRLFDAISDEGIVKVCERCSIDEHIPLIRRPTILQLKESERKQSVYERLSPGIKSVQIPVQKPEEEITLREIVERNFEKKLSKDFGPRPELINNFHWVIMRGRRLKKLTQAQLAKEIGESETAIKMAEQGRLPEDDNKLVKKFQNFLGINIIRPEFKEEINPSEEPKWLSFDMQESKELTIEDIKEMRRAEQKKEEEKRRLIEEEERALKEEKRATEEEFREELEEEEIAKANTNPHSDLHKEREAEITEEEIEEDSGKISKEEMDKIIFGK